MNAPTADPNFENLTQGFKDEFINKINLRANEMTDDRLIPIKARFREAARRYQYINSIELFNRMADVFRREIVLLNDYKSGNYTDYVRASREIDARIETFRQQLNSLETLDLVDWKINFDNYQVELLTNQIASFNGNDIGYGSPSHAIELDLHMSVANLFSDKLRILTPQLAEKLRNLSEGCDQLINNIIDNYIKQWKFNQQKYGNNDFNINGADLEKLQDWCEKMARILLKILQTIDSVQESRQLILEGVDNLTSMLMTLRQSTSNSLIKLVRGSVVIETQPPQVIKANTK
jgi:hypothetical protein